MLSRTREFLGFLVLAEHGTFLVVGFFDSGFLCLLRSGLELLWSVGAGGSGCARYTLGGFGLAGLAWDEEWATLSVADAADTF